MEKSPTVNPGKGNKAKKKPPLKVVYITNPIRFKASASEFRALVQELTGQDADVSDTSRFAAAEANVRPLEELGEVGHVAKGEEGGNGSDLSTFDADAFFDPQLMGGSFQGFAGSNILWPHEDDVFKS